ncbi:DNA topoisomerase [Flavobacterium sp. LHD-80]|uniref:type IA DNA topoisomerase n=1 Tax=Flavobacterium sp. LHD-80 TaxID=3071411 RepID=UPI0027DFC535|nr:DNA topoisomerase [Flavobacterium sp. LHD-80]MDQ6472740.1 DNA topoisomerase [Flavobacterium sp. LHD-80]
MKTVIAEKPSVAREIATLLGAIEKKEGYLSGNGYFVTWAFGHLIELGMPEDYGICKFGKKSLPILPDPFLLTPRKEKKDNTYTADASSLKQLKIIGQLIEKSKKIIAATDAGCEGELIFRYIYQYLNCSIPFERLWISSLTQKAIKQGFENLKPGSDFDGLYKAALSRSRADWLIGINASQALTIAAGDGNYSLGRVQTPILALICRRYLESKAFSVQKYWQLQLLHTKEFIDFKSLSKNKWEDKKSAEHALKCIERNGNTAIITSVENKKLTEKPPLLFDLTGLQKEANKKLNFSAEETLNIAQGLYEKKFITYPRTASKYIPEDMWEEISTILRAMQKTGRWNQALNGVKWGYLNKSIINDLRITDHHGLLITEKMPFALSAKENALYNMIAQRILEAISQDCIKEITAVSLQILHYEFTLKGSKIIETGWRMVKGNFSDDATETLQILPELKKDNELKIKNACSLEKTSSPPMLYTEADLLSAMETATKQGKDQQEGKVLQNTGIGTPSTRAAVIEILFARNYIERQKKYLVPTQKGLQVFELVKDKKISDVSMTAEWEEELLKIEKGKADAADFQNRMEKYAVFITDELLQTSVAKTNLPDLLCPKCNKKQLIITSKIVKCPNDACSWFQFRNVCGVQLSIYDIESLVSSGKTHLIKAMQSKTGKKFDAYIKLNNKAESSFEFEKFKLKNK